MRLWGQMNLTHSTQFWTLRAQPDSTMAGSGSNWVLLIGERLKFLYIRYVLKIGYFPNKIDKEISLCDQGLR